MLFGHRRKPPITDRIVESIIGNATSAAVGVASAAVMNKIQESSQLKLQEQQAKQEAELQKQQAEYNLQMEKLRLQQEEVKLEMIQPTKRYYANCPKCMGANTTNQKECSFCGASLAYYDEADNK